ncbi:YodL domain-containing protein [Lacrimispora amygdalina]|uniref:YodL domain-containing protein n=1 Tax=Lacrimispora amygdalina TaxID=253257 RepID=UPI003B4FFE6E
MPDVPVSKANVCAQKAYEIWEQTKAQRSAQIIFCDLSTPKPDGSFSVYDAIKKKLVELGVPAEEIAFIHDAKTDIQKDKLFKQVRSGEKRFLLGSTFMMGAGTNVQRNLIAEHHLDVPWRPSDIEQREGRIIRQGNENDHVWIFRYITSGTFDAYSWQVIENKQKFISQIMTSKSPVRSCADLDDQSLSYAEVKALATGNPYIKEKMELDISVSQLNRELANHKSNIYRYQDDYTIKYPQEISRLKNLISGITKDIELYKNNAPAGDEFTMVIGDKTFTDRTEAGEALIAAANEACVLRNTEHQLGTYLGFKITARKVDFSIVPQVIIGGEINYIFDLSMNAVSNISSITRTFHSLEERVKSNEEKLSTAEKQLEIAKIESEKPFPKEELYKSQIERLQELNALLGISEKEQNETGIIDDSTTIKVDAIKRDSSWIAFEAYDPDNHPEEYDIAPDLDTVEFITVGEENMNETNSKSSEKTDSKNTVAELPIEAVAMIEYIRKPGIVPNDIYQHSEMLEVMVSHTEEAEHDQVFKRYDQVLKEAEITNNSQPKLAILQLKDIAENDGRRFVDLNSLHQNHNEIPNVENYELIYVQSLDAKVEGDNEQQLLCEKIFKTLNGTKMHPVNYYGHSLSVSDVVVVFNDFDDLSAYYVSRIGFTKLPEHFVDLQIKARIKNEIDIRRELSLYKEIEDLEEKLPLIDFDSVKRAAYISATYSGTFELADRRKDLIGMESLGYELALTEGPNDPVVFQSKNNQNDIIQFEEKDAVRDFITEVKGAMDQYTVEELQSYHAGDYSKINAGLIDKKAVEVAIKQLLDIRQREGRLVRQGNEHIFIDGHVCKIIDEWTWNQDNYIMGQSEEDPTFFYVTVGGETFEYDSRPIRVDVENDYINILSMRDIDRHEEEYGADGRRAFPHLNDVTEVLTSKEQRITEYDLVFGSAGNGITVWNQNEPIYSHPEDEVHMVSDYRTLAYISPDGDKVTWFADNLPDVVVSSIEAAAEEQREKFNPDILTVRGIDVERDLSDLPDDELSEFLKDKEVTYIVESVERYKNGQIDSGDKFILSTKEFMEPLKAFGDKNDGEHNLYVCIMENENRLIYVINENQLENEAKRYLLQLQESETNPIVRIDFSESGMFHDSEYMSFIDAGNRLAGYNKAATELDILGYQKTYFSICALKENKVHIYDGRYDIGSDSGSLLEHIQDLAQYQTSETYKAMMKTQCNKEEYKQWEIEQDKFINEWIPGLQLAVSKQVDKESEIARYQQEYKNIYLDSIRQEQKEALIGPLSLADNIYTFYQDGNPVRLNETFKQAALGLLTSKGCGNGKGYLLTMKLLDQEIPILRGSNAKLEIPVPEIDKVIDISENSDMKNILEHVIATVKPNVIDPYNDLDLSFEQYAAHEGNNIWQNPAMVYRSSNIVISVYEETALNELNREFKCYLKPQDILAISEQKCLGSKPVDLSKEVKTSIETVKSLVETYIAEKPELPQPEAVLQPDD